MELYYVRLLQVILMLMFLHILSVFSAFPVSSDAFVQPSLLNLTKNLKLPPPFPTPRGCTARSSFKADVSLDPKSVLAIMTNEMAKLAMLDIDGSIGSFQSTPWAGYSDTSIEFQVLTPTERVELPVAIWSLWILATSIGQQEKYNEWSYKIRQNNVQVAMLRIYPTTSSQPTIERRVHSTEVLPYLQEPSSLRVNSTSLTTSNDPHLVCSFLPDAEDLSVTEVLGGVIDGLKGVAPASKTDRMDGVFTVDAAQVDSKVFFEGNGTSPDQPRYQYQYVFDTLRAMPVWLLSQQRLAEMGCRLIVDNQWVGMAYLEQSWYA